MDRRKNNVSVRLRFNTRPADLTFQHIPDLNFQLLTTDASKLAIQQFCDIQVETFGERKENCVFYLYFYTPLEPSQFKRQIEISQAASGRLLVVFVRLSVRFQASLELGLCAEQVGLQSWKCAKLRTQDEMDMRQIEVTHDYPVSSCDRDVDQSLTC